MPRPLTHRDALEAAILAHLALVPRLLGFYGGLPWSQPAAALVELLETDGAAVCGVGYETMANLAWWAVPDVAEICQLAHYTDALTLRDLLNAGAVDDLARQLLAWDHDARLHFENAA